MNIFIGDYVPFTAQVFDKDISLTITVNIFDPIGKIIETIKLIPIENGLYAYDFFKMPDVEFIRAQYVPSDFEKYTMATEVFWGIARPQVEKIYTGEVIEEENDKDIFEGVICEN